MAYTVDPRSFLEVTLREFFEEDDNMEVMTRIIKNDVISLRTLDWFIGNYSKKNNVMFTTTSGKLFNIFMEYKSQLKSYSKRMFDSFNRGDRITCKDHKGIEFSTTIGQLNFFRWVIKNGLIDECMKHIDEIESDMTASMKQRKNSTGTDSKRKELSKAAIKSCQSVYTHVVVTFS